MKPSLVQRFLYRCSRCKTDTVPISKGSRLRICPECDSHYRARLRSR